jgi:hypothetical protein
MGTKWRETSTMMARQGKRGASEICTGTRSRTGTFAAWVVMVVTAEQAEQAEQAERAERAERV